MIGLSLVFLCTGFKYTAHDWMNKPSTSFSQGGALVDFIVCTSYTRRTWKPQTNFKALTFLSKSLGMQGRVLLDQRNLPYTLKISPWKVLGGEPKLTIEQWIKS